jgi:hypothetical protein
MPLSFTVDPAQDFLLLTGHGALSVDDILEGRRALAAHPEMKFGMRTLVDLRGIEGFNLSGHDVLTLAQAHLDFPFLSSESRTAIVVADATGFALARMYVLSRRRAAEPMAVFYEIDDAKAWLQLGRNEDVIED